MDKALISHLFAEFGFTPREFDVISMMITGVCHNKGVAKQLGVSEFTVKNHIDSILKKTRVQSKTELLALMVKVMFRNHDRAKFFMRIPRVMIVDDSPDVCDLLHDAFKQRACQTYSFTKTTPELVDWIGQERIDLLISDINIGELNGFDFLQKINSKYKIPPAAVLMTSDTSITLDRCLQVGAQALVYKPIIHESIFEVGIEVLINYPQFTSYRERTNKELDVIVNDDLDSKTCNIGTGGMFIQADPKKFVEGQIIHFKVNVPHYGAIVGKGEILWKRETKDGSLPSGFGIKFTQIKAEDKALLLDFVKTNNIFSFIPIDLSK